MILFVIEAINGMIFSLRYIGNDHSKVSFHQCVLLKPFHYLSLKLSDKSVFFKLYRFCLLVMSITIVLFVFITMPFFCTIYLAKEVSFEDFFLMSACYSEYHKL